MERLVATSMGMAASFYAFASSLLWYVVIGGRLKKGSRRTGGFDSASVLLDRAIAWASLAVVFAAIAARKMDWLPLRALDIAISIAGLAVTLSGLWSVRQITREKFGNAILSVFAVLVLVAGVLFWFAAAAHLPT